MASEHSSFVFLFIVLVILHVVAAFLFQRRLNKTTGLTEQQTQSLRKIFWISPLIAQVMLKSYIKSNEQS